MNGKALLAKLLGTTAAPAAALAVAAGKPGLSAEDQAAGTTQLEALVENAHAEGMREGRTAERTRFGAVLTSSDAEGRLGLAISLLSTTDLTAEAIISNIKAAPKAAETPPAAAAGTSAAVAPGQREAADPLATRGDPIAEATPTVGTGAPREPAADGLDEKAIVELWAGALAGVSGSGVTAGSVWDGLIPNRAN